MTTFSAISAFSAFLSIRNGIMVAPGNAPFSVPAFFRDASHGPDPSEKYTGPSMPGGA